MKNKKHLRLGASIRFFVSLIVIVSISTSSLIYYYSFKNQFLDQIYEQANEVSKQIVLNYNNYIDQVAETANYLANLSYENDSLDDLELLTSAFTYADEIKADVQSIVLYDILGKPVIKSIRQDVENADKTDWFLTTKSNDLVYNFSTIQNQENSENIGSIVVSKVITYFSNDVELRGVLALELNVELIQDIALLTNFGEQGFLSVIAPNNEVIFSTTSQEMNQELIDQTEGFFLGLREINLDSTRMLIKADTVDQTRWRVLTILNANIIDESLTSIITTIALVFIISLTLTMILVTYYNNNLVKPLYKLQKIMKRVDKNNFQKPDIESGQIEIVELASTFSNMLDDIENLMNKNIKVEQDKRHAEFKMLEYQINPHFLYNTLDSIIHLVENKQNEEATKMVLALSKFFRISLSKGKSVITLEDELKHVDSYLSIQKIRFNDKFDYIITSEDKIGNLEVIKLILQPLAENALNHGLSDDEQGIISINAYTNYDQLKIEVTNNGYGMTPEDIEKLTKSMIENDETKGIGLRNIYQRLINYYKGEASITLESELDEYFKVILTIPIRGEL